MMKQRIIVAVLTVLIFGAGFAGGLWTESHRPLPPPPAALLGEFTTARTSDKNTPAAETKAAPNAPKPYNRAQLVADIEKLRPQIDAYRARLDEIDREFDATFVQLLTAEQRQIYDAKLVRDQKQRADHDSKTAASGPLPPLSEEEIARLRQRPFENAFWKIAISGRLEGTTKEFKLDPQQVVAVRQLLIARREKFLSLVDSLPPPTFKLSSLATSIQRLVDPAQATPAK